MKKIKLTREVIVPSSDYCYMWKGGEVCPFLSFRRERMNPKEKWECTFFDTDLKQNLNSFGIKKYCEKEKNEGKVVRIH